MSDLLREHFLKLVVGGVITWFLSSIYMFYPIYTSFRFNTYQTEITDINNLVEKHRIETNFVTDARKILSRHIERINKFMDMNLSISDIRAMQSGLSQEYRYLKKYNPDELNATKYFYNALTNLLKQESFMWDELKTQLFKEKNRCCIVYGNTYRDYRQSFDSLGGAVKGSARRSKKESKMIQASLDSFSVSLERKVADLIVSSLSLLLSIFFLGLMIWYLFFNKQR